MRILIVLLPLLAAVLIGVWLVNRPYVRRRELRRHVSIITAQERQLETKDKLLAEIQFVATENLDVDTPLATLILTKIQQAQADARAIERENNK